MESDELGIQVPSIVNAQILSFVVSAWPVRTCND